MVLLSLVFSDRHQAGLHHHTVIGMALSGAAEGDDHRLPALWPYGDHIESVPIVPDRSHSLLQFMGLDGGPHTHANEPYHSLFHFTQPFNALSIEQLLFYRPLPQIGEHHVAGQIHDRMLNNLVPADTEERLQTIQGEFDSLIYLDCDFQFALLIEFFELPQFVEFVGFVAFALIQNWVLS